MKKILYFISGEPTNKDKKKAASAGAFFRDARAWHEGDFTEQCDAVMGKLEDIPPPYQTFLAKAQNNPNDEGSKEDSSEDESLNESENADS